MVVKDNAHKSAVFLRFELLTGSFDVCTFIF